MTRVPHQRPNPLVRAIAFVGAQFIYFLIWLFGRRVPREAAPWLDGPVGGALIGDRPYEETAEKEGLVMTRDAREGGLLESFDALRSDTFDPDTVDPRIRRFYERTTEYRMDVWPKTYFPSNLALWLLVKTISREVDQLNFPTDVLDIAEGMESEIIHLRDSEGALRYAGWFRSLKRSGRVLYTGFYLTEALPEEERPCVKVVFPMPGGNATVLLRPSVGDDGRFLMSSHGRRFGAAGFYRLQTIDPNHLRVWRIASLREDFELYVDEEGDLRCDHRIRFLGLPVITLHFRITPKNSGPETSPR